MTVSEYLNRKGLQYKRKGEEAQMNCPFCAPPDTEKKFSVNLTNGAFNCLHLNRCGSRGSFTDLQRKFGDTPIQLNGKRFVDYGGKPKYKKPNVQIKYGNSKVVDYLHKRGFTDKTIEHFNFGSHDDDTVMIPFYKNKELVMVKYRSISNKKKMWTSTEPEPILFNRDNIEKESIVICEGEYDAAALYQYGVEAVSVPMGAGNLQWIDNEFEFLDGLEFIYLCFDSDQAGQKAANDAAIQIGLHKCKLVTLPYKDANECLRKGVSQSDIISAISSAKDFRPDTLVTPDHFRGKVRELFIRGPGLFGIKTPWEQLNRMLKGWRDSEITVWSGKNGAGKSTILNQVLIDLAGKGVKTCIYSGEMAPERYLRWAVIQYQEKDNPTLEEVDATLSWMSSKVWIIDMTAGITQEKLLSDFTYAARRFGVKHFIVDSLMKISFEKQDEYRQQQEFMNSLCGFAKTHAVHVHLVAHPRKTDTDDDEMGKVDVKGTSHITDLADNVIVLQRVSETKKEAIKKKGNYPADMKLFVKKNREFGIEGSVNMSFNVDTKNFSDGG
jgi:twinkle protein